MQCTKLPTIQSVQPHSLSRVSFGDILAPCLHKGTMVQTHYVFRGSRSASVSFQVKLDGAEEICKAGFEGARNTLAVATNAFPYGMTKAQWWEYCVAPHSYLALEDGTYQIGLNLLNRFLHLDFIEQAFSLVDPEVNNELLSTTNWFDHGKGDLWFASWPIEGTVRRLADPRAEVLVTIWKRSLRSGEIEKVWQGDLGDALHQLCLDSSRRFLILTELGLRFDDPGRVQWLDHPPPAANEQVRAHGLIPSKILVLDLKTGREWRLSTMTAGHIEFDPEEPGVCYLSGHTIGLKGVKVGIAGSGIIYKYRIKESGPELLGAFTHERFHRITTHILFRHRGKQLIAVSGYPGQVFLIDAASMTLYKVIAMDSPEKVDTSIAPHICGQDSYGVCASNDGEALFIAGTGFVRVADIAEGRFIDTRAIDNYGADCCFTGHLGKFLFTQRDITCNNR